jgi:hypothetical protein
LDGSATNAGCEGGPGLPTALHRPLGNLTSKKKSSLFYKANERHLIYLLELQLGALVLLDALFFGAQRIGPLLQELQSRSHWRLDFGKCFFGIQDQGNLKACRAICNPTWLFELFAVLFWRYCKHKRVEMQGKPSKSQASDSFLFVVAGIPGHSCLFLTPLSGKKKGAPSIILLVRLARNNNADMTSMKLPVLWSAEKKVSIPAWD